MSFRVNGHREKLMESEHLSVRVKSLAPTITRCRECGDRVEPAEVVGRGYRMIGARCAKCNITRLEAAERTT